MKMHPKFWSRKLLAATLSAGLLAVCWIACQWLVFAREYYSTLATSIVALFTAYSGANVVAGLVATKVSPPGTLVAKRVAPKSDEE